jgi:AraC-like DNA-binding protein
MLLPRIPPGGAGASDVPGWPAAIAVWGPGGRSGWHAHHAMHLVVRLEGDLRVRCIHSRWLRAPGVLVGPDVEHEIDASSGHAILLFIEPESDAGLRVRAALEADLVLLDERQRGSLLSPLGQRPMSRADLGSWVDHAIAQLAGSAPPRHVAHPRVRRVLRHLQQLPPDGDTSLEALARIAGLSPGRLMHAFTQSIGVPLRPYLLWHKLKRAAAALSEGRPVGEAAHLAGFSDAAHLTRTFRRMLGTPPSVLQHRSQFVQAHWEE